MNTDLAKVIGLEKLGDYRLKLQFSDGSVGEWNFSELARYPGPMCEPFKDTAFFARVFIEMGALTWPNGYDCCPDSLYKDMKAAGALEAADG